MPRRITGLVALVAVLAMGSSVLDTCAGWGSSAEARMECCAAPGHMCEHSGADACCAEGEQRKHAQPGQFVVSASPVDVVARVIAPPDLRVWYPDPESTPAPVDHPDTYLLLSVFLV